MRLEDIREWLDGHPDLGPDVEVVVRCHPHRPLGKLKRVSCVGNALVILDVDLPYVNSGDQQGTEVNRG